MDKSTTQLDWDLQKIHADELMFTIYSITAANAEQSIIIGELIHSINEPKVMQNNANDDAPMFRKCEWLFTWSTILNCNYFKFVNKTQSNNSD